MADTGAQETSLLDFSRLLTAGTAPRSIPEILASHAFVRRGEGELRRAPNILHGTRVTGSFSAGELAPENGRHWTSCRSRLAAMR